MQREECEKIILEKAREIVSIYHEYNQDGGYLNISYLEDDSHMTIFVNNSYSHEDNKLPLNVRHLRVKDVKEAE